MSKYKKAAEIENYIDEFMGWTSFRLKCGEKVIEDGFPSSADAQMWAYDNGYLTPQCKENALEEFIYAINGAMCHIEDIEDCKQLKRWVKKIVAEATILKDNIK